MPGFKSVSQTLRGDRHCHLLQNASWCASVSIALPESALDAAWWLHWLWRRAWGWCYSSGDADADADANADADYADAFDYAGADYAAADYADADYGATDYTDADHASAFI